VLIVYIFFVFASELLKEAVKDVKVLKTVQANHGVMLEEILQRLRNKGLVLEHPKDMPRIPLDTEDKVDKMEAALNIKANHEYLVGFIMYLLLMMLFLMKKTNAPIICRARN